MYQQKNIATVKITGDEEIVAAIRDNIGEGFRILTESDPKPNDRGSGFHVYLTIEEVDN